ncbi:MAG: hypothetical protein COS40_05845 [Deltaproteobacteria bacterium CG03_land_8_20_14_0_80_45_14]|jgi:hypothetical protein|nr:MAG: hypothetical protein COS40_05845 [Deltaproteobacteria bacterium CG03_land_8_20_14_0_80_45_14]
MIIYLKSQYTHQLEYKHGLNAYSYRERPSILIFYGHVFLKIIGFIHHSDRESNKQKVRVFHELGNARKNNLGIPLPGGTLRISNKEDGDGNLQFIGEDRIDHTPKDEKLKIKIGEAFDAVGEKVRTDYKHLGQNLFEVAFEVSLRNHKKRH